MTKILSPRTNAKTYRIKNENGDEEDITLHELNMLTKTTIKHDPR